MRTRAGDGEGGHVGDGRVTYGRAPAVMNVESAVSVLSVEARAKEWDDWLTRRADEDAQAEGEEEAVPVDPLLVEGLAALQHATDRALASQEKQLLDRLDAENEALRAKLAEAGARRRSDADSCEREIVKLTKRLEAFEAASREEVEEVHAALRIEMAEAAEARSVERLRSSSWMKRHKARVGMKLAQRELVKEARQ